MLLCQRDLHIWLFLILCISALCVWIFPVNEPQRSASYSHRYEKTKRWSLPDERHIFRILHLQISNIHMFFISLIVLWTTDSKFKKKIILYVHTLFILRYRIKNTWNPTQYTSLCALTHKLRLIIVYKRFWYKRSKNV